MLRKLCLALYGAGWLAFVWTALRPDSEMSKLGLRGDSGAWFSFFCLLPLLAGAVALARPPGNALGRLAVVQVMLVAAPLALVVVAIAIPLALFGGRLPSGLVAVANVLLSVAVIGSLPLFFCRLARGP